MSKSITIEVIVDAPIEKVWKFWNEPAHITKWAFAIDSWEAPFSQNDLRIGGKFLTRMQAKDKSFGFDFGGIYTNVILHKLIEYTIGDGRKVSVKFEDLDGKTKIIETFEMEKQNSEQKQRDGWQAILNNFKKHTESV